MGDKRISCREENEAGAVPSTAAERFKNAAAILKARDVEDRRDYKERKRKQAAELKAKKRSRDVGDEDDLAVMLGPGLGFPTAESKLLSTSLCSTYSHFLTREPGPFMKG